MKTSRFIFVVVIVAMMVSACAASAKPKVTDSGVRYASYVAPTVNSNTTPTPTVQLTPAPTYTPTVIPPAWRDRIVVSGEDVLKLEIVIQYAPSRFLPSIVPPGGSKYGYAQVYNAYDPSGRLDLERSRIFAGVNCEVKIVSAGAGVEVWKKCSAVLTNISGKVLASFPNYDVAMSGIQFNDQGGLDDCVFIAKSDVVVEQRCTPFWRPK